MSGRIEKLEKEFDRERKALEDRYSGEIEKILVSVLKEVGLYETKARYKSLGKEGYLRLKRSTYSPIMSDLVFRPVRKDGGLSKQHINIYGVSPDADGLKEKLLELFEPVGE